MRSWALVFLSMLWSHSAAGVELGLETRPVAAGSQATLSVYAADVAGVGLLDFELEYDWGALTLVEVRPAGYLGDESAGVLVALHPEVLPDASGRLRCAVAAAPGLTVQGRVLELVFDVALRADGDVSVQMAAATAADTNGQPLEVSRLNGGYTIITAVDDQERPLPAASALLPNYPNPFNPSTTIPFQLARPAVVELRIYNVMGQLVRVLTLGELGAGYYDGRHSMATWDGRDHHGRPAASGVYLIQLRAGDFVAVRKSLLVR